jgi:hypothetical protein
MRQRIVDYMDFIDGAYNKIKELNTELESLKAQFSDENLVESAACEHFAKTQYLFLISQDLEININKLVECYSCSKVLDINLNLNEEELVVLDKYVKKSVSNFVFDKGTITPKRTDLLDIMISKANQQKGSNLIKDYIKQNKND